MPDSPAASDLLASLQAAVGAQYDIERALGAGGMGTVFLARDRTLERPVAIKVISPELAASKPFRQRFLQEARTVAKLRHPNIVAVYAAGEAGDPASGTSLLYFVMEYVPGESLRDLIDRERGCDTARSIAILRDLASALGYAHTNGIVHRDIKPENVLLDGNTGHPRLTDFGVAQALSSGDGDGGGERMTGVGFIIGSPSYMSPEQASGEREIDGRSDIYSLGLVGYEMFSGQPTFTGPSAVSVIAKQITERPTPLAERVKDVPPEVAAAIDRALEKDPAMRWSSGSEMARALETGVVTAQYTAGTRAPAPPRNRTRIALLAAVAALVVAVPVGWLIAHRSSGVPSGVDPRKSFFVAPFENQTGDPSLAWMREGAVSMLTLGLAGWSDLNVVDYERTLDLLRDDKLDTAPRIGIEDARQMAREGGVWTVVLGRINKFGDSLRVTASVYDVASGNAVRKAPLEFAAPLTADPRTLFDSLARDLLDLAGAPPLATTALAKTTTSSLDAYRAYLTGVRALNSWQFDVADSALDRAIRAGTARSGAARHGRATLPHGPRHTRVRDPQPARHGGRAPQAQARHRWDDPRDGRGQGGNAGGRAADADRRPLLRLRDRMPDPRWPLHARSFAARARLYEQLGEKTKADSAYSRFIELWKEADPQLQPQVRAAREALAKLRDAPPAAVKRGE